MFGEVFVGSRRFAGNWSVVDSKDGFVLIDFFAFLRSEVDASVGDDGTCFIGLIVIPVWKAREKLRFEL